MKNKVWGILFSLVTFAIAFVFVLVFLIIPNLKKTDEDENLSTSIDDISVAVGERVYDYCDLIKDYELLTFNVDKEGLIVINKDYIEGVSAGEVNVEIIYNTASVKFKVIVYENEYKVNFIATNNCTFVDNNILISNNVFQFRLEVLDTFNNKLENVNYTISSNNKDLLYDKSFLLVMISTEKECEITFEFPELSLIITKNIKFQ